MLFLSESVKGIGPLYFAQLSVHTVFLKNHIFNKVSGNGATSIYIPWRACALEARQSWTARLHERASPARLHPDCDLSGGRNCSKHVWSAQNGSTVLGLQRDKTPAETVEEVWPLPCALYTSRLPSLNKPVMWIWAELKGFQEFLWGFLVAQWWRIHLPMKETQIWSLVWEDPTWWAVTKLMQHNFWAQALEPGSCNKRSHRNEKPTVARVAPTHRS